MHGGNHWAGRYCGLCGNEFFSAWDYQAHTEFMAVGGWWSCMPEWEMNLLGWTQANCGCWLQPVERVNEGRPTEIDIKSWDAEERG